ncbi:GNAT family N-acetyltransferase [Saccharibacillus sacchari]|uniref:GNAT family N-acetyltransferase n=1 Tax=Saccharibacillus sacchari TaxID=456493 RepID=A0ACC6P771_9BACL
MNENIGDRAEYQIRDEMEGDAGQLVELFVQLGYPASQEELSSRLTALRGSEDYAVRVAEQDGKLIGMIAFHRERALLQPTCEVRVMALVVAEQERGSGIGSRLLVEAEEWAREQNASYMRLNSGIREERSKAHVFYMSHDYNSGSIGFSKKLLTDHEQQSANKNNSSKSE